MSAIASHLTAETRALEVLTKGNKVRRVFYKKDITIIWARTMRHPHEVLVQRSQDKTFLRAEIVAEKPCSCYRGHREWTIRLPNESAPHKFDAIWATVNPSDEHAQPRWDGKLLIQLIIS